MNKKIIIPVVVIIILLIAVLVYMQKPIGTSVYFGISDEFR